MVAIKNAANEILWSWHIWVTTYDGSTRFTNNDGNRNVVFMDRALGASTSTAGLLTSCGLMYQWGRKDPFPGIGQEGGSWSISSDADPVRVYNASGTPYEISKALIPNVAPNTLSYVTRNPDTFYFASSSGDWFTYNGSPNNDLWSGGNIALSAAAAKSVFDPCPAGWRIPPWLNNVSPFKNMNSGWSWGNNGMNLPAAGGYFPASGYRYSFGGGFCYVSERGYYWSGAPTSKYGYSLYCGSGEVNPANYNDRANGFPVRCCLE